MTEKRKDVADLFAGVGEREARESVETMMEGARDALSLLLEAAPEDSRARFAFVKKEIVPLLMNVGDAGERRAALDDVAKKLKLGKRDLGKMLSAAERSEEDRRAEERDAEVPEDLAPEEGTERYRRAMELLHGDDILDAAARAMERLGHVGEHCNKQLGFVCAVSARAGFPIQPSTHADSSTGKNYLWDTVLSLIPEEMVIRRSAISAKALFRTGADLKGAVLYLQEMSGSEDAEFTLRVLQSDGKLVYEATEKDESGQFFTVVHEKEGPTVVIQTTTRENLYVENATRVLAIYLDESQAQTARIIEHTLRSAEGGGIGKEERAHLKEGWQDAVRLLEPLNAIVPFASRIEMPSHQVRTRRDVDKLVNVIRVVAFIHQHSRERDAYGRVMAEERDFHKAVYLVSESLGRAWKSLSPAQEVALERIDDLSTAKKRNGFSRADLDIPERTMSKRKLQDVLKSLTEAGHLEADGRRGSHGFSYTVVGSPGEAVSGIHLRAEGESLEGTDSVEASSDRPERRVQATEDDAEPQSALDRLTELGWYREAPEGGEGIMDGPALDRAPLARALKRNVPVYVTESERTEYLRTHLDGENAPVVFTLSDVRDILKETPSERNDHEVPEDERSFALHLRSVVASLERGTHDFYNPASAAYCEVADIPAPEDPRESRREAMLQAKVWRKEGSEEVVWALLAVKEDQYIPDDLMERAVLRRIHRMEDLDTATE